MKILAIGAHPDDVEIGCGGFLIKASRLGHNVNIFLLTLGGVSGDKIIRKQEATTSAEIIGAENLWFGGYEDTKLGVNSDLINSIEEVVVKADPDLILTHSIGDEHHDHRAVGYSTIEAARYYPNIITYELPLIKDFKPEVFIDISDTIEEKVELLSLYKTQNKKEYITKNAIYGLASYRARQSRLKIIKFAEAFQVVKLTFFQSSIVNLLEF